MSDPFPVLTVCLGDALAAVDAASEVKSGLREVEDIDMVLYQQPCVVRYAHPERPFSLPPTTFVSFDVALAKVARVVTSPQLRYASTDEMGALVGSLFQILADAGWPGPRDVATALSRVQVDLARAGTELAEANAGVWQHEDGTEVRVDVKRTSRGGGGGDRFLVNVAIHDPARYTELCAEVRRAREQAGLSTDRRRVLRL